MTDRKSRKVLIINNIKSDTIDQAIFILKGDSGAKNQGSFDKSVAGEAQEIIDRYIRQVERLKGNYTEHTKQKKAAKIWPLVLLVGCFASIIASVILVISLS